jgi:hypothetical protein
LEHFIWGRKFSSPKELQTNDNIMALQGNLTIAGGKTYGVVECAYNFHQAIDETGKPVSRPQGGTITFVMPANSDDDLFFYRWMFNKTEVQSGYFRFIVYSNDNKKSYKTVEFINAYCIELKDYFNDNDSKLMYTTVTISAQIIRIGGFVDNAVFTNEWT